MNKMQLSLATALQRSKILMLGNNEMRSNNDINIVNAKLEQVLLFRKHYYIR